MVLEYVQEIIKDFRWKIRSVNGEERVITGTAKETVETSGDLRSTVYDIACKEGRARRIFVQGENHFSLILEQFDFDEPQCVYSSFLIPTREDLVCNVANKNRLVLRYHKLGTKAFRVFSETDGQDNLEISGLLFPDGFCSNNTFKITPYSGLYTYAKRHVNVYTLMEDEVSEINLWHIKQESDDFIVSKTAEEKLYKFTVVNDVLTVESLKTNAVITIKLIR